MNLDELHRLCHSQTMIVTAHCMERIIKRSIELSEVTQAIMKGEVIEDYPDDYPYSSALILGNGLHVVADTGDGRFWLITAYRSDAEQWENDLKTRRESK